MTRRRKLSDEQVAAIKRDRRSTSEIAASYGVHRNYVLGIRKGIYYADVPEVLEPKGLEPKRVAPNRFYRPFRDGTYP